jgi:PAS domain S-box-containing protein
MPVAGEGTFLVGEEAFRNMFEGHSAVMYIVDLTSFSIVDANEAALRFYGYDRETMLTKRVPDLNITPEEEIRAEIARAVDEGRSHFVFPAPARRGWGARRRGVRQSHLDRGQGLLVLHRA